MFRPQILINQVYMHFMGSIRCRVGSVSARSLKCGGCGGLGFGLVRNHVWTEKICLLLTMSRMGYIKICLDGKCSCRGKGGSPGHFFCLTVLQ